MEPFARHGAPGDAMIMCNPRNRICSITSKSKFDQTVKFDVQGMITVKSGSDWGQVGEDRCFVKQGYRGTTKEAFNVKELNESPIVISQAAPPLTTCTADVVRGMQTTVLLPQTGIT